MLPATTPKTCAHILTKEEARDALSRVLRVCRESGYRNLGIPKRIFENRELVRCLYEQHMALGQAFTTFIGVAESSRRFFDSIVDALKETFPDVGQFPEGGNKSGAPLPEETRLVMKCLDGLIAVCGTSGDKLTKLQTENREIACLLKSNPAFSERLGFIESWLEDHELFFEDMRHALKDIFKKVSGDAALPTYGWVGNDLTEYRIQFNSEKLSPKRNLPSIDINKTVLEVCKTLQKDYRLNYTCQPIRDKNGHFLGVISYHKYIEGISDPSDTPIVDKFFNNILFRIGVICIIGYHMFHFIQKV